MYDDKIRVEYKNKDMILVYRFVRNIKVVDMIDFRIVFIFVLRNIVSLNVGMK